MMHSVNYKLCSGICIFCGGFDPFHAIESALLSYSARVLVQEGNEVVFRVLIARAVLAVVTSA